MAVICFDLIPEAIVNGNISVFLLGVILGCFMMIGCDVAVEKQMKKKVNESNSLIKTGIIVAIGLAIHNIPEGLAIGSGFDVSRSLGISLAIVICLHDIPEGLAMSIPMKKGGISKFKILMYVILSGITTAIGTLVGSIIGGISKNVITFCLSFASGAMLYIVSR